MKNQIEDLAIRFIEMGVTNNSKSSTDFLELNQQQALLYGPLGLAPEQKKEGKD